MHCSLWAPADTGTTRCRQSKDRKPQATSQSGWAKRTTEKVWTCGDLNQAKTTAVYRQTKKLPYRKYYGFKLTETSWWVMSKVWGWHWYLDVYEKLPAANASKCSQEKPQLFRQVKLRKSYICSSHILPRETHTLKGWRIQSVNTSGPKHTSLAWAEDYSPALTAKAGMSTSRDCSRFAICENAAHSHCTQQNQTKQETRAKSFLESRPKYCSLQNTPRLQGIPNWTLWLHLLTDWIKTATGLTFQHLPTFLNSLQHDKKCCPLLTS